MNRLSHAYATILMLLLVFAASACVTPRPQIDSVADAIAVSSADIKSVAQTVQNLCMNTVEDGPCAAGSLISTDTKDSFKRSLQGALDYVSTAKRLLAAGQAVDASDNLALADAIILAIQAELERRQ